MALLVISQTEYLIRLNDALVGQVGCACWTVTQKIIITGASIYFRHISRGHREGGRLGSVKNFKTPFLKRF